MPENNVAGYVIPLVAGFGVAAFIMIIMSVLSGSTYQITEPMLNNLGMEIQRLNYTFTASNTSMVSLGNVLLYNGTLTIQNKTFKSSDANANYTVNYNNGSLKLKAGGFLGRMQNGKKYNATYYYRNNTLQAKTKYAVENGITGLQTIGNYMPLIVLAFVAVMLLSLIFMQTGGIMGSGGGGGGVL